MEEQMQYQLFTIPHDKNLEQYSKYIEEMASSTAELYKSHPEIFNGSGALPSVEPDNTLRSMPMNSGQTRVMLTNKTYTDSKTYSVWFKITASYIVTWNLDHPSYKWISRVIDVYGTTSYLGNLQGYIFSEKGPAYKGWSFNATSSKVSCWITGTYRVVYNNITEERGQITLYGDFEAG